jgi:bifunctional non-homologous end joining protein LigD
MRSTTGRHSAIGKTTVSIPSGPDDAQLDIDGRELKLTNLNKIFWPQQRVSKRDLLQYYADIRRSYCRI